MLCFWIVAVVSDSLQPDGLQHARLPCPSLSPRVCSNSFSLNQWCHPTISSFAPFSSCPQSSPASEFFQWVNSLLQVAKVLELQHQFFQWMIRVNSFRIDWFDLLAIHEALKSLRQHYNSKASILQGSAFFMVQLSHPYMTTGKNHSFDYMDLCQQSDVSAF